MDKVRQHSAVVKSMETDLSFRLIALPSSSKISTKLLHLCDPVSHM